MNEIKDSLRSARNHRRVNTAMMTVLMLMLASGLWIGILNGRAIAAVASLSTSNTKAIMAMKASQEVIRQQYLNYINDMIDAMNKMQRDNQNPEEVKKRGVKVPKWPVLRPPGTQDPVTESDLRRIPQPAPTPTPIVKTSKVYITKKPRRSSPTPKPFQWPWEHPKSTR